MNKIILTARINEYAMRDENLHVPWSVDEIVADAIRCREAGASAVHFHARDGVTGSAVHTTEAYAAAIAGIRERTDLLIEPPLGYLGYEPSLGRADQVAELASKLRTRPHIAALDVASVNLGTYDPGAKTFRSPELVFQNPIDHLIRFANVIATAGLKPVCVCWNVSSLRTVAAFADMGLLRGPLWLALRFTERGSVAGHPATPAGLQAYLDFLPTAVPVHWMAVASPGSLLPIAEGVIAAGGHLGVGIGDYPYPELNNPTNEELLRHFVTIAQSMGREIASPLDARDILGI